MIPATARPTVGVLLSVYGAVRPNDLRQAVNSIVAQGHPPDEVVVVVDGPLGNELSDELQQSLDALSTLSGCRIDVVRLPRNVGAGPARQAALCAMSSSVVAIHDADDVSREDRLERMLGFLAETGCDLAGSALLEFDSASPGARRVRRYPLTDRQVRRAARINNPIGHPSMVFSRELALTVGGYRDLPGNEDYDLVIRMLAHGGRAGNVDEPLVSFRMGPGVFDRRGGWRIVRSELELSRGLLALGVLGPLKRWPIFLLRVGYRLAPPRVKAYLHPRVVA